METVLETLFAVARSAAPSPLKSPIATDCGRDPTATSVAPLKPPCPSPKRMETEPEVLLFAEPISCQPSPLKSPTATENGFDPTATLVVPLKPPCPSPKRMETEFELPFAVAIS